MGEAHVQLGDEGYSLSGANPCKMGDCSSTQMGNTTRHNCKAHMDTRHMGSHQVETFQRANKDGPKFEGP